MPEIEDEYDLTGKSLLITARREGFRRGGIAHSKTETLHSADEFTGEQLAQIMAENGKELIVKVVEVKDMHDADDETIAKVAEAIRKLTADGKKANVKELTEFLGFDVDGKTKEKALALIAAQTDNEQH